MQKILKVIFIFLVSITFGYLTLRSTNITLTHDEAFSFTYFVDHRNFNPLVLASHSNNHLLNTVGMIIGNYILGGSELALRLFSVVAFLILGIYFYKILNLLKSKSNITTIATVLLSLVILINPFFLEFFAFARGYSLGLAFLTVTIFYLLQNKKQKYFFVAAFLSIASNFIFVYPIIFIILVWILQRYKDLNLSLKTLRINLYKFKYLWIFILANVIINLPLFIIMFIRKQFYIGGTNNFVEDSLGSLSNVMVESQFRNYFTVFLTASILYLFIVFIIKLINQKSAQDIFKRLQVVILDLPITSIFIFTVLLINLLFYVINFKLPMDRSAMWILLIGILSLIEVLNKVSLKKSFLVVFSSIFIFASSVILLAYIPNYSLSKTTLWEYNACDKSAFNIINSIQVDSIVVDYLNVFSINYYNLKSNSNALVYKYQDGKIKSLIPQDSKEYSLKDLGLTLFYINKDNSLELSKLKNLDFLNDCQMQLLQSN